MKYFLLILSLSVFLLKSIVIQAQCTGACTQTITSGTNITINATAGNDVICVSGTVSISGINNFGPGDQLCIQSGNVTLGSGFSLGINGGTATAFATINVASGATLNYAGGGGTGGFVINNAGTFNFTNSGIVTLTANNPSVQVFNNLAGGVLNATATQNIQWGAGSDFTNAGTINANNIELAEALNPTNTATGIINVKVKFYIHSLGFIDDGRINVTCSIPTGVAGADAYGCGMRYGDKGPGNSIVFGTTSCTVVNGLTYIAGPIIINGNAYYESNGNFQVDKAITGTGGSIVVVNGVSDVYTAGSVNNATLKFYDVNTTSGFDATKTSGHPHGFDTYAGNGTPAFTIAGTQPVNTWLPSNSIGSTVFIDINNDGIQSGAAEIGIAGLTIQLYSSNADGTGQTLIGTTTTDGSGNYIFTGLSDGNYVVKVTPNATYPLSSSNTTTPTDNNIDSNDDGIQATSGAVTSSPVINLTAGAEPLNAVETGQGGTTDPVDANGNTTVDFGFTQPVSLGSTIFQDVNNDGIQNATEVGLVGATVTLYKADGVTPVAGVAPIVTGADGNYYFSGLPPGQYVVGVLPPAAWPTSSTATITTDITTDDGKDNGTQTTSGTAAKSPVITLTPGAEPTGATENATGTGGALDNAAGQIDANGDMTVDFGFFAPVSIGSTVFIDANNDGIQNPTEVGLAGAIVKLYLADGVTPAKDIAGNTIVAQTTNGTGNYYFPNLPPGNYVVGVTPPSTTPTISSTKVALDNQVDGDNNGGAQAAAGGESKSPVINLTSLAEPTTEAAPGVGGAQDNTTATSDASGDMTVDFGFYAPVSIGSTVWFDANNDGIQQGTEVGIAGAVVTLYKADGVTPVAGVAPITTNGTGNYYFSNLAPGDYVVGVKPSTSYPTSSTVTVTTDNQTDADDNGIQATSGTEAKSPVINLTAGVEPTDATETAPGTGGAQDATADNAGDMTVDFGFFAPVSIGSTVFNDANNNGTFDGTEVGLAGAIVKLYHADGTPVAGVAPITTNGTGNYYFGNLPPGDYKVGVTPPVSAPSSSTPTIMGDTGTDDNKDHGTQASSGAEAFSGIINLSAGLEPTGSAEAGSGGGADDASGDASGDMTIDFGFFQSVSIGSTVFFDENNNGKQDASEVGIAGAIVTLYQADGVTPVSGVAPQTTTGTGLYFFEGLAPGTYVVGVLPPALYPLSSTDITSTVGDNQTDGDDNGVQSGGSSTEAKSSPIALAAGTEPTGTAENAPGTGGDQDTASGDNAGDMTVDFGFYAPVSIGSTVFNDVNNNGTQDAGDLGLAGATVRLYLADGTTPVPGVAPQTTGTDGNYYFANLAPGSYVVGVTPPVAYPTSSTSTITGDTQADDAKDHGTQAASGAEAKSGVIVLKAGTEPTGTAEATQGIGGTQDDASGDANGDMTVDFGFFAPVSIGSMVYFDKANNGAYDAGTDTPLDGAIVTLYKADGVTPATDATGAAIAPITTDATGLYYFGNLLAGDYVVGVTPPAKSSVSSTTTVTADDNGAGDGLNNGTQAAPAGEAKSPVISLLAGTEPSGETLPGGTTDNPGGVLDATSDTAGDMTVDFAFYAPVSIGSLVFNDLNNNGIFDSPTETPLAGAVVKLYNADGSPTTNANGVAVPPITTDATGLYYFGNLLPGDYKVGVTPPSTASVSSTPTVTTDDNGASVGKDHGIQASPGAEALSPVITLAATSEATGETSPGGTQDNVNGFDSSGDMSIDFGFFQPVSIGSLVYLDKANNGAYDAGTDTPIQGAIVTLYKANGTTPATDASGAAIAPITTGTNGLYYFGNLLAGDYVVGVTPPATSPISSTPTVTVDDNGGDGLDNGTQASSGAEAKSPVITLTAGTEPVGETMPGGTQDNPGGALDISADASGDMTVDFGFYTPLSIGSTAFNDNNNNGSQDIGETGIPGLTVNLNNSLGDIIATTTTNQDGNYAFNGLIEGTYSVGVSSPTGGSVASTLVTANNGSATDIDGKNNGTQAFVGGESKSGPIVLLAGSQPTNETGQGSTGLTANNNNGNATVDFGFYKPVNVSGNVFVDPNGTLGDNTVNGTPFAAPDASLYIVLVDASGNIAGSAMVGTDGTFSISNVAPGTYTSVMTTSVPSAIGTIAPIAGTPLTGYANVGETLGTAAGSDGTNNGINTTQIVVTNSDIPNINYGLDMPPIAVNKNATPVANPTGSNQIIVPTMAANDPEEGPLTITGSSVKIEAIPAPATGKLYYNGMEVMAGDVIPNFDPLLLKVDPTDGAQTMAFKYSVLDAAGISSLPATVTIPFTVPLPIDLVNFNAKQINDAINLSWKTTNEKDFSHFEVQKSLNAKEFGTMDSVNGNNSGSYNQIDANPIEGVNYYRLKMVDKDGKSSLSNVISVNFEKGASFVSLENPARNGEFLLNTNLKDAKFTLLNSLGTKITLQINEEGKNAYRMHTQAPAGVYYLNIESNGKFITRKIVIQ